MGILDFFRKKIVGNAECVVADKNVEDSLTSISVDNKNTNVEIQQDVECEEEQIKKELLAKSYNRKYVFCGQCEQITEVNGQNIKYLHIDYFLADNWWPSDIKKVIKLTGTNLDGKPIPVTGQFNFTTENRSYFNPQFVYNGQKYSLAQKSIDSNNLKNHYITGQELADRVSDFNLKVINQELKRLGEQQQIDVMFAK